jgi:hypothetical protein
MKDIRYVRKLHCALLILFPSVHFSCDFLFVAAIKIHFFTSIHVNLFQLQIRGDAMTANDKNLFPYPFCRNEKCSHCAVEIEIFVNFIRTSESLFPIRKASHAP